MYEQQYVIKRKNNGAKKLNIILIAVCILLIVGIIALSVMYALKVDGLDSDITLLRTEISAQKALIAEQNSLVVENKSIAEQTQAELADALSEIEKYRKIVNTLESTNAEQKALIESLTTPLNGRDEKTLEPADTKIAYLTFDDGPSENTDEILRILTEKGAVATFFVINSTNYLDKLDPILKQGSALAMHSATHNYSQIYSSVDAYFADLKQIQDVIYEKTGVTPKIMRLPGGSSNLVSKDYCKGVVTDIVERLNAEGYTYFDWNVDSGDASGNASGNAVPAATLLENVKKGCKDKQVVNILMHDTASKSTTVEALPQIIDYLISEGYIFMTLSSNSTVIHHTVAN